MFTLASCGKYTVVTMTPVSSLNKKKGWHLTFLTIWGTMFIYNSPIFTPISMDISPKPPYSASTRVLSPVPPLPTVTCYLHGSITYAREKPSFCDNQNTTGTNIAIPGELKFKVTHFMCQGPGIGKMHAW